MTSASTSVTSSEKIGFYSDFKTFSIYVTDKKELLSEKFETFLNAEKLDHAGLLVKLISNATENDYINLETLEIELNSFDDKLSKEKDLEKFSRKLSYYRKSLTKLKHYYEKLNYTIDFFLEHKDFLETTEEQDRLLVLSKRIPKLFKEILYLMDNLSQIRDNYQSQLQLKQNNLMKMFTIITAICMPLQLIAGWYGMNLIMPEMTFKYTYPIVVACCVVIITTMIIIFKKKKWFK